ncbi:aconitase family protein, partial [Senegalimassilia anaerobia]|uniref:aconitase family protein n=1 Tax=Senegalimassilia anaerobia TaxID=1473216 RepID=UPI003AB969CF
DVKIDQAVIGSCTTGRLEDMRQAADVLRGRKVHPDVRCIVIPATVAWPHLPSNTRPAAESRDVKIDQAVIGSCTNGRLEDMRQAADVLRGRKVHPDVRCIVIPATQAVYKQCIAEGLMDVFLDANCAVSTPTCGPCLGGYMGILAAGERCVSTSNRNFVGRMGDPTSEVYLASPAIAAASAVLGHIGLPEDIAE